MFTRSRLWLAPAMEDVVAAFKVLGLTYNPRAPATARPGVDDVRRQYREMARLHHPDLSSGDDNRMKVVNTAYELIQSSGVLQGAYETTAETQRSDAGGNSSTGADGEKAKASATRFSRKAGTRRRRMPDDFANGDDSSWSMKTQLDWQAMMNGTDAVTEAELKNPANHPFSHSRFFSFEDDLSIYRMIRGGATVPQVARTLGKPATFVERRLQNAQFKLRVQYVLRQEKRSGSGAASTGAAARGGQSSSSADHTTSTPITEAATRRVLRRSPYEDAYDTHIRGTADAFAATGKPPASRDGRKKEWEASYPEWRAPRYRAQMTLEEQGRMDGLLRDEPERPARHGGRHSAESKLGRTYENYQRMKPK